MQLDLFDDFTAPQMGVDVKCDATPEPVSPMIDASPPSAPPTGHAFSNLAEVAAIFSDAVSDDPRRVRFRSAINCVADSVGRPANQISADPVEVNAMLARVLPAASGMKPRRWIGLKCDFRAALREAGMAVAKLRTEDKFAPEWEALVLALPDRGTKIGLSRFIHFLSDKGRAPSSVDTHDLEEFRLELEATAIGLDVKAAVRQAAKFWNKAAKGDTGWPQVFLPESTDPRRYSFQWERFPASFREDFDGFQQARTDTDIFDPEWTDEVRPATRHNRFKAVRQVASSLVQSGAIKMEDLVSLEVLTRYENLQAAFQHMRARAGGKILKSHVHQLYDLRTIALHWVKDEERAKEIKRVISAAEKATEGKTGKRHAMQPKNRERLRQVEDPENLAKLYDLPYCVLRRVRSVKSPGNGEAVLMQRALIVAILCHVPIRAKNLTQLELGKHLIIQGSGRRRLAFIHLERGETKTDSDYNAPLPEEIFPLLDAWLETYRPIICPTKSPYLFPNPRGELRSKDSLSEKLKRFLQREIGLVINIHLCRHIAAYVILRQDPYGGIEVIRQLLGHSDASSTWKVYSQLQQDPAFRRLDEVIFGIRDRTPVKAKKGARK